MRDAVRPAGVMVSCMRLCTVVRASGRTLSTAAGRQQRRALGTTAVANPAGEKDREPIDPDQVTRQTFVDVQEKRNQQAKCSILISCPPKTNEKNFLKHLSRHGEVLNHFFFETHSTHVLVEYANTECIDSLLAATKFPKAENYYVVPFKSRLLTLKSKDVDQHLVSPTPLTPAPITKLLKKLCAANSIEDQAHILMEEHQLTEESIRLRYLVSSLVSDIATAYFPEATIELYGSSVNSFGKTGCDLDLFLNFETIKDSTKKGSGSFDTEFWMRRVSSGRAIQQKVLSVIGECIESFGPSCSEVQKILGARCPLIRFFHHAAGLQCDLTASNRIALKTSELLYIYGNIDSRVRPLVFTLRCWARVHGITSVVPGHWITNFSLTMMILFFLQNRNPPVIPTLDELKASAGKKDKCIINNNDCTFLRDPNKVKPSQNGDRLDDLLIEFMEFYGNFDFNNCIDIRKGVERIKPENSPLYIQNPFEEALNVSKNVNKVQVERFVLLVRESSWILQERTRKESLKNETWGLASILTNNCSDRMSSIKENRASERLGILIESLKTDNSRSKNEKTKH